MRALSDAAVEGNAAPAFFQARPELRSADSVEQLHQEVLRVLYADLGRAGRLARAALMLAGELDDPASHAAGLRAMGHVSYAGSNYEEALRYYTEALGILEALGRNQEIGRTLLSGLQSLSYLGRYREAYEWAGRAGEIFRRLGDELRLGRLASNVGNILYRQDRYAEALASYEGAYAALSRLGEHRDVAAVLSNMAVCNISLSRFTQALEFYGAAREYCRRHDLPQLVAGADYNIAYLHYVQGDFMRAIALYKTSREHYQAVNEPYHGALCDLDEAEIYLELNLNGEAAQLAARAAAGFQQLGMPYERGKSLVTQAIAASRRGQPRAARRFFEEARAVFAGERNVLWPALIDLYRATLMEREGSTREAGRLCRRAYRVLGEAVVPGRAALAELLLSRLSLKDGRVEHARQMCDRAFARLEGSGTPWLRFHAQMVRGQVEERSGNAEASFESYQCARLEIETLRSRLWGDEVKISFLKDKLAVYENLVSGRLAGRRAPAQDDAEAFHFIQQAKSRSLAELISRPVFAAPAGEAPSALDREIEEVRRDLNSQYRHMEHVALSAQFGSAAQVESLKKSVREREMRLTHLVGRASAAGHAPAAAAEPMTLEAIQQTIPAGAMLLEYYVVKGVLYVCLLDGRCLEIVPLAGIEEIRTSMRLMRFQFGKSRDAAASRRPEDAGRQNATASHLRDLYDVLIGPIRGRLGNAGHLIFAPHDFLHHLPFHALLGAEGYVMDECTVSYAPSATVYALCSARPSGAAAGSLVLGLPDERAPQIRLEAETAARALPESRLFLAGEATEEVLRRLGPASRYIHIASHGLFRRDNPLFSAIRLGDSHLTLLDLYSLSLSAELVTLSGCSTGLNVVVGGDELLGLMRGLLLGGAQSVMLSLWDVNDLSAARFMGLFYDHLPRTGHKAAALQSAMRALRAEYPDPYHWAPFVLAGKHTAGNGNSW
jgi:CHAT domain-containing protein/tetratricopeptide (TPR) repeat protein